MRSSMPSSSRVRATPSSPPAASPRRPPCRSDRPRAEGQRLQHVGAALETAVDDHLGAGPPTASTTSARISIGAGAWSSWRPPWFETWTTVTPCSTARRGVLGALDALDDEGQLRGLAAATPRRSRSASAWRPSFHATSSAVRLAARIEAALQVALAAAIGRAVDGERQAPGSRPPRRGGRCLAPGVVARGSRAERSAARSLPRPRPRAA